MEIDGNVEVFGGFLFALLLQKKLGAFIFTYNISNNRYGNNYFLSVLLSRGPNKQGLPCYGCLIHTEWSLLPMYILKDTSMISLTQKISKIINIKNNIATMSETTTSTIKCAPSRNLNVGFPHFATAREMYDHLREITKPGGEYVVRNFVGVIEDFSVASSTVETELFPRGALEYYTKKNMGWDYSAEEKEKWQLNERGGEQGDYRDGMKAKIANVIDCLRTEPLSKRAVIPIPFSTEGSETVDWKNQGQNKCCRELHLYLEDGKLKTTGIVRMQNANIMVKNIHFFATLVNHVAKELGVEVGEYTHWITNLCHDRTATSC